MAELYTGLLNKYQDYLPIKNHNNFVSLCEGNTPLVHCKNLPKQLNFPIDIYLKFEGLNPTGSFKDRGMTVAVSHAKSEGREVIMCASTGNTSAAAAAYAARAGMQAVVLIPEGKIALGKLAQAMFHGAKVLQIKGNFDDAMNLVKEITKSHPIALVNSVNPYRLEGQKTAAFEIIDSLGNAPDYHCLPVGNAGNISAYWMGYTEYFNHKKANQKPKMLGFQAAGAAPFLAQHPIENPETVATAIRIGNPQSWDKAIDAVESSQGWFEKFDDKIILETQKLLAQTEGIFCEPASAVSIAGLIHGIKNNKIKENSTVVCTLTGHGLKDPDIAIQQCPAPTVVKAELNAILGALG